MSTSDPVIYLDNNATTPVAPECVEEFTRCLAGSYGNPSSLHRVGAAAKELVIEARGRVASLLGGTSAEIVFTSGATESNHLAILGALSVNPARKHVVTSVVEHPSTLRLLDHLETQGVSVTRLPVDSEGRIDLLALQDAVTPETALVSLMWANNETGVLFPVEEAATIARSKGALFHTDATQAVGKCTVDVAKAGVDLLSFSGHKVHAPKGIGAFYVRKGLKWPPLFFGHQERGRRGGTENVPALAAFGVAAELAREGLADGARVKAMRDRLESGIVSCTRWAQVNGGASPRVHNTSNIRFGNLDAEMILNKLDKAGICASSGAACTAGGTEPSHVLTAMGQDRVGALAAIRFSLSRYTTEEEIDRVLEILPALVNGIAAEAA
jgi:cysteine desulfurase